jgi:hypothetical protein
LSRAVLENTSKVFYPTFSHFSYKQSIRFVKFVRLIRFVGKQR